MEGEHCSQVGSAQPLSPPCPCPGVPAATSRRWGQPGEGGAALGHAGGPGPQEQGTQRGGGCCPAPRRAGGLREGLFQPLTSCYHSLSRGCPPRCCSGWRPGGSRGRRWKRRPWSGRWKKPGKTSGRRRWVPQSGGLGWLRGLSTPRVGHAGTGRGGGQDAALGVWCWGCHHAGGGGDGVGTALGVSHGL